MSVDLTVIDPKNGKKFSPNLYRFLKKVSKRYDLNELGVYIDNHQTKWIGILREDGWFSGCRLTAVLCYGAKEQIYAHPNMTTLKKIEDFWSNYEQVGRCAIDPEHQMFFIDDKSRWDQKGDLRECIWCGCCSQSITKVKKMIAISKWV